MLIFERPQHDWVSEIRHVDAITDGPLLRCEVSLKVSEETSFRFSNWSMRDRRTHRTWATQAMAWHSYGPAHAQEASDFPHIDHGVPHYPFPPGLRHNEFTAWSNWAVIPEPRFRVA